MTQAYLSYKGLFLWLNWPAFVSNVAIRPVLTLFMFALVGRFALDQDSAEYYMIGLSAHAVSGILLGGIIQGFFYERLFGTLSHILRVPRQPGAYVLQPLRAAPAEWIPGNRLLSLGRLGTA